MSDITILPLTSVQETSICTASILPVPSVTSENDEQKERQLS